MTLLVKSTTEPTLQPSISHTLQLPFVVKQLIPTGHPRGQRSWELRQEGSMPLFICVFFFTNKIDGNNTEVMTAFTFFNIGMINVSIQVVVIKGYVCVFYYIIAVIISVVLFEMIKTSCHSLSFTHQYHGAFIVILAIIKLTIIFSS